MAQLQFEKEYSGDQIRHLVVKNPNGRILFTGWDRPEIRIRARIEVAGSQVPDEVSPRVEEEDHTMTIKCGRGFHPIPEGIDVQGFVENVVNIGEEVRESVEDIVSGLVKEDTEDDLNELSDKLKILKEKVVEKTHAVSGRFEAYSTGSNVRTDLEIQVPSGISLQAKSMNGVIGCESFQGPVEFKATNGQIRLKSVTGKMELRSVNGLIVMESCHPHQLLAKTLNGPIKGAFTGVSGEIYLKTLNGPIRATFPTDSDLALEIHSVSSPVKVAGGFQSEMRSQRRFSGKLGSGGNAVRIKTVSGPVTVVLSGEPAAPPAPPVPPVAPSAEAPESIVERMVKAGKISPEEAEALKAVL